MLYYISSTGGRPIIRSHRRTERRRPRKHGKRSLIPVARVATDRVQPARTCFTMHRMQPAHVPRLVSYTYSGHGIQHMTFPDLGHVHQVFTSTLVPVQWDSSLPPSREESGPRVPARKAPASHLGLRTTWRSLSTGLCVDMPSFVYVHGALSSSPRSKNQTIWGFDPIKFLI